MVDQPSYRPQNDPRPPAEGSVPRGAERVLTREQAEKLANPLPVTAATLARGRGLFGIYCTPCHGASGKGNGLVGAKMPKPADLTSAKYVAMKDGFFFDVIHHGSGLMPPQAESMYPHERWYVVNYIRRLQRP
jgi:mono/diheme cytochrome c family protein